MATLQDSLFDKHNRPVLQGMTDACAWFACTDYEDHAYNTANSLSEGEWDRLISDIRALYDEYYALFG